jgi:hypothetical protein
LFLKNELVLIADKVCDMSHVNVPLTSIARKNNLDVDLLVYHVSIFPISECVVTQIDSINGKFVFYVRYLQDKINQLL